MCYTCYFLRFVFEEMYFVWSLFGMRIQRCIYSLRTPNLSIKQTNEKKNDAARFVFDSFAHGIFIDLTRFVGVPTNSVNSGLNLHNPNQSYHMKIAMSISMHPIVLFRRRYFNRKIHILFIFYLKPKKLVDRTSVFEHFIFVWFSGNKTIFARNVLLLIIFAFQRQIWKKCKAKAVFRRKNALL